MSLNAISQRGAIQRLLIAIAVILAPVCSNLPCCCKRAAASEASCCKKSETASCCQRKAQRTPKLSTPVATKRVAVQKNHLRILSNFRPANAASRRLLRNPSSLRLLAHLPNLTTAVLLPYFKASLLKHLHRFRSRQEKTHRSPRRANTTGRRRCCVCGGISQIRTLLRFILTQFCF